MQGGVGVGGFGRTGGGGGARGGSPRRQRWPGSPPPPSAVDGGWGAAAVVHSTLSAHSVGGGVDVRLWPAVERIHQSLDPNEHPGIDKLYQSAAE